VRQCADLFTVLDVPVEADHRLEAVRVAGLDDQPLVLLLEVPAGPPRRRASDHVVGVHVWQDRLSGVGSERLREREDVGLDLSVQGAVFLRVVERVTRVGPGVDVVATNAAVVVDPVPEGVLPIGDRTTEHRERSLRQVRQDPEVDAAVVRVHRVIAGFLGHTEIRRDLRGIGVVAFTSCCSEGEHAEYGGCGSPPTCLRHRWSPSI
jgi:hypothetical protein